MPWKQDPNIWGVIGAILISLISGFISVASAMVAGHKFSLLWLAAQLAGACLAGWLVWDMFPAIEADMPAWITQPIATSLAAHYGGKCFSIFEKLVVQRFNIPPPDPTP